MCAVLRDVKNESAVKDRAQFHFVRIFFGLYVSEFRNSLSAPVLVAVNFLGLVGSDFLLVYLSYVPPKIF